MSTGSEFLPMSVRMPLAHLIQSFLHPGVGSRIGRPQYRQLSGLCDRPQCGQVILAVLTLINIYDDVPSVPMLTVCIVHLCLIRCGSRRRHWEIVIFVIANHDLSPHPGLPRIPLFVFLLAVCIMGSATINMGFISGL